jgi:hypothetical protein
MSTRNLSWGVNAAGAYGWQPTTFKCRLSRNLGASTSWNPVGLHRPVMGLLYLYFYSCIILSLDSCISEYLQMLSLLWMRKSCDRFCGCTAGVSIVIVIFGQTADSFAVYFLQQLFTHLLFFVYITYSFYTKILLYKHNITNCTCI